MVKKWTKEKIEVELNWMLNKITTEEKNNKIKTLFKKELCVERGYAAQTWIKRTLQYKNESWFKEKWDLITDILHIRLIKLGLSNSQKTTMCIWLDKVNYGSHESMEDTEKNVTINIKREIL
jgi:hypothetical protein